MTDWWSEQCARGLNAPSGGSLPSRFSIRQRATKVEPYVGTGST